MQERIAVIGLGYVGLPLALGLAKKFVNTIGFDLNIKKIATLQQGIDPAGEIDTEIIKNANLKITHNIQDLKSVTFFIVAVPTPIDQNHCPDLKPLISASETIGQILQPGTVIVYESTVYPGVTEEICGPILAQSSGLKQSIDFKLGYSPERINPGDREHTLEKIIKVVSGEDPDTLERVANVYGAIIEAGVYRAPSIKVAEAAKVIENIQRDLNIALMNELALIFNRLNIRTQDVLKTANTKWNFLPFKPGLVGGHCIGVDPYYLATKAEQIGHYPEVILAGRRINDKMGVYIGHQLLQLISTHRDIPPKHARIGILGITFKENIRDIRNSRIPDIIHTLEKFSITPFIHDPMANAAEIEAEYNIKLNNWEDLSNLDVLLFAVPHRQYLEMPRQELLQCLQPGGILMDIKSIFEPETLPPEIVYWSL